MLLPTSSFRVQPKVVTTRLSFRFAAYLHLHCFLSLLPFALRRISIAGAWFWADGVTNGYPNVSLSDGGAG